MVMPFRFAVLSVVLITVASTGRAQQDSGPPARQAPPKSSAIPRQRWGELGPLKWTEILLAHQIALKDKRTLTGLLGFLMKAPTGQTVAVSTWSPSPGGVDLTDPEGRGQILVRVPAGLAQPSHWGGGRGPAGDGVRVAEVHGVAGNGRPVGGRHSGPHTGSGAAADPNDWDFRDGPQQPLGTGVQRAGGRWRSTPPISSDRTRTTGRACSVSASSPRWTQRPCVALCWTARVACSGS